MNHQRLAQERIAQDHRETYSSRAVAHSEELHSDHLFFYFLDEIIQSIFIKIVK